MQLDTITMPKHEAEEKLREYRDALDDDVDDEVYSGIARALRWLRRRNVQGLLDLPAAIAAGGADERGLPQLAVMSADEPWCWVRTWRSGSVQFTPQNRTHHNRRRGIYHFPAGTVPSLPPGEWGLDGYRAMVPFIPPSLRPKRALHRYAVLWEVERWERAAPPPPEDPALLRHVGGDLFAIMGTWDLTPLERSVLAGVRRNQL